jgi:hypothetical protein
MKVIFDLALEKGSVPPAQVSQCVPIYSWETPKSKTTKDTEIECFTAPLIYFYATFISLNFIRTKFYCLHNFNIKELEKK